MHACPLATPSQRLDRSLPLYTGSRFRSRLLQLETRNFSRFLAMLICPLATYCSANWHRSFTLTQESRRERRRVKTAGSQKWSSKPQASQPFRGATRFRTTVTQDAAQSDGGWECRELCGVSFGTVPSTVSCFCAKPFPTRVPACKHIHM